MKTWRPHHPTHKCNYARQKDQHKKPFTAACGPINSVTDHASRYWHNVTCAPCLAKRESLSNRERSKLTV